MLIAREKEIAMLKATAGKDESQFVAIYGRRRVGKTYLIRETFDNNFVFQHSGLANADTAEQLEGFANSLKTFGLSEFDAPRTWLDAFQLLKQLIVKKSDDNTKKIIFIDELSWMDAKNSNLMTALEAFWNGWASARKDILLIVCASATSWMLDNIIHNKGGLYNRLNLQIHLRAFNLRECEMYLSANGVDLSRSQILEGYMVMGGVPYYWSFVERGYSMSQNIDKIFFGQNAPLKREFDYLYASLYRRPDQYISIVRALGMHKAGLTREELLKYTGIADSGDFSKKLTELEECDFIREYTCFGKKRKSSVFQLIDNFTLFHFKFLTSKTQDEHFWTNAVATSQRNAWCGLAFERVCLEHVPQIKAKLSILGVSTEVHSWLAKKDEDKGIAGSQIDLLIVRRDMVIDVCEMKYSIGEYNVTKKDDDAIRRKISDFITATGTKYAVHPILVASNGMAYGKYSGTFQMCITADDLFKEI